VHHHEVAIAEDRGRYALRHHDQNGPQRLTLNHDFLLKGDVFTKDVIATWLEFKRKHEVDAIRLRRHPSEFALYFDI
jgi:glutamine synthetase